MSQSNLFQLIHFYLIILNVTTLYQIKLIASDKFI